MKKIVFSALCVLIVQMLCAQAPQSFQYQAVIRDAGGIALVSQPVNFRVSIISGSVSGTIEYVETHSASTNGFGIAILNIGSGIPVTGTFSGIIWANTNHFIKIEADPTGGTSYLDMGTTQLLSVPYSLYSEKAGNIPTYSGGNGIDVTGTTITNTAPDQPVTLTEGGATTITGSYPNFSISSTDNNTTYSAGSGLNLTGTTFSNTAPDQPVSLTQGGATTITGTYPNFTISSTDNNTTYSAGSGLNLTGTTFSNTAPDQAVSLTQGGATTITGTYPNFTISSTDNNTTYSAGSGLSLAGTTFTNTAPDQAVTMTNGAGITITGTYPSFTVTNSSPNATHTGDVTGSGALTIANNAVTTAKIADGNVTAVKLNSMSATNGQVLKYNGTNWAPAADANTTYTAGTGINVTGTTITNTAPDQTVTLTQGGATTVSGTYPNFTVSSTDLNSGTPGGLNKTVQYNNNGVFAGDTAAMVWDNANKRLGIGTSNPLGRVVIKGSSTAPANEPLFEVKNSLGQQIMAIYNDSVHFFITDIGSNRGGFAVSGRNNSKALTNDFLRINADSTRVYTSDAVKGFGVRNIVGSNKTSYMQLNPNNYFIGHESGIYNTTGSFNSFLGYQAGKVNTVGSRNIFIGYQSGMTNIDGTDNVSIGNQSLFSNSSGYSNTANGYQALYSNTLGYNNNAFGYKALFSNTGTNLDGYNNNAFGTNALYSNTFGHNNNAMGTSALYSNTTGTQNVAIGYQTMYSNTTGWANVAVGNITLYNNITGPSNTALGDQCLYNNSTGGSNVAVGRWSLYYNNGSSNTAVGAIAYFSATPTAYTNSTALGNSAVITGSNMVRVGSNAVTSIGGQVGWTTLSDGRFKTNIKDNVPGLEFITKLKPVTYNVNVNSMDKYLNFPDSLCIGKNYKELSVEVHTGFVAQDVEKVANELGFDFSGVDKPKNEKDYYGLRYAEFTVPLVKAVQELNTENIGLKTIIENQNTRINDLQKQIDELKIIVNK